MVSQWSPNILREQVGDVIICADIGDLCFFIFDDVADPVVAQTTYMLGALLAHSIFNESNDTLVIAENHCRVLRIINFGQQLS